MDFTYLRGRKVWEAVRDHPDAPSERTVYRWCEGSPVPYWATELMRATLRLGDNEETAPPGWAERLLEGMFALEAKGGITDAELAAAQARVAAYLAVARQRRRPPKGSGGGGAANA